MAKKPTSLTLDEQLIEKLNEESKIQDRSVSYIVNKILCEKFEVEQ